MKSRARLAGQGACLKGMSRTITMQGFTLAAKTDVEKKLRRKHEQSQWTVKYRSRALGQDQCLKGMSRTITIQGFTLAAITDVEIAKLDVYVDGRTDERTGGRTDGRKFVLLYRTLL